MSDTTRVMPAIPTALGLLTPERSMPAVTSRVARAVYGLVDDQYGVVAHTPNLSRDEAQVLCHAVGIGDPAAPIDDALSFLAVPGWGLVCTRYATRLDARGRLALGSDSVALDVGSFWGLRNDPFRCMPRRGADNSADVPRFTASTSAAEQTRLAELRRGLDAGELRALLAALLAGERVLWVGAPLSAGALQSLVLLLPPALRRLMTFQTAATRAPTHAPRLTCADRRYADFGAVAWTRELPRERDAADRRADAAADALLALPSEVLPAAHALYEELASTVVATPAMLLGEVERVVRYGAFLDAVWRDAAAEAVRVAGASDDAARDAEEFASLAMRVLAVFEPSALGAAIAALVGERDAAPVRAAGRFAHELLRQERAGDGDDGARGRRAAQALDAVLDATASARWGDDEGARRARAVLAAAAARRGDAPRLLALADADAPWDAVVAADTRGAAPASPAARLTTATVAALAHAAAHAEDIDAAVAALDVVAALGALPPGAAPAATRRDAARIGGAVAARGVAALDSSAIATVRRFGDAALRFAESVAAAEDEGGVPRALLAPTARLDAARVDDAARALAARPAAEQGGWVGVAALRALDDGRNPTTLAAVLDQLATRRAADGAGDGERGRRNARRDDASPADRARDEIARSLGAVLHAAAPDGPPLGGAWPAVLAHADAGARRALLARTLGRAARDPVPLDTLAATCGALAALDFRLDGDAARALAAPLGAWAKGRPATRPAAIHLGAALALLTELADAQVAAALVDAVLAEAPRELATLVRLRRLAVAVDTVEATRDGGVFGALRDAVRGRAAELLPEQRSTLRAFFGITDGIASRLFGGTNGSSGAKERR